jgi:hypothetical protein
MVPKQDAIERPDGGHEIVVVLGEENKPNQCINRGIFDADTLREPG